jgi:nucleoside 2-deoxyribosyltransferase
MKVYLAARYSQKGDMQCVAALLEARGIEVTSTWLKEHWSPGITMDQITEEELVDIAALDLADIDRADGVILFSLDPLIAGVRGGRHVEFGYALGKDKPIVVVGPKENIFHYLPRVKHCATITELFVMLGV